MVAYDELHGAKGRKVRFRAPRYDARRVFPNRTPKVRIRSSAFRLHDISLGGLSALSERSDESIPELGETVDLSIQQAGIPIFESTARICRTESTAFGSKIALSFLDHHIEFDKLLTRNTQAQIAARALALDGGSNDLVSRDYKAFCADALRLLRAYHAALDESELAAEAFRSEVDPLAAFEACAPQLLEQWRSLWLTGNDLASTVADDREARHAMKEFTELVLTPEMRHGAIWDRSYAKPLGYPGDFEIMNQVYDWQRVGRTTYDMLLHRVGLEVAECIATRMEVVRDLIIEMASERVVTSTPLRVASLGSGPAREVEQFLNAAEPQGCEAEFSLIDQEPEALLHAYRRTLPSVQRANGRVRIQGLNISFTDILRGADALAGLPPQDLVYSVGLLDYLADRRAKALVKRLFELLMPGGLLVIGNMNKCRLSNFWPMEFIVDWTLQYRDDADMLAWTDGLTCQKAWTDVERTGRVRLLYVRK
jgi:hypothetical protein